MWRKIHENYELSVRGEVRNITTQRILKNWIRGTKPKYYLAIDLGPKRCNIHQLVAKHFLPAPTEENCVVDHMDRNRYNNNASNLRWVNHSVNATNKTIVTKTSLGENHHIRINKCQSNIDYIFNMVIAKEHYRKIFKTLEEAKEYRDRIINTSEYKEKS
jgi:hypothetical protein